MAIVDKLKANIKAAGGDTSGIHNIEDAVAKMGTSGGGSSGGSVFFVNAHSNENSYVALDKTFREIKSAFRKGPVVCVTESINTAGVEDDSWVKEFSVIGYSIDRYSGEDHCSVYIMTGGGQAQAYSCAGLDSYPGADFS